jgi:lipid IVA palmitoyltransferase
LPRIDTYTEQWLKKLNEKAWGAGIGKTVRNEKGDEESLYLMAIRDSDLNSQWMAGYSYQWMYPISMVSSSLEVGIGITALLIRRDDWFVEERPFPPYCRSPQLAQEEPNSWQRMYLTSRLRKERGM